MKKIDIDNKIFKSDSYKQDSYMFYLIEKNFDSSDLMLYSDEDSYVICRGKIGLPTWIWTKDNIEKEKVLEIEKIIDLYLTDNDKDYFTCKKKLYNYLKESYQNLNLDDYFEMGFLICEKTKEPKKTDGHFEKANIIDLDILTKYLYNHYVEIEDESLNKTFDDAKEKVIKKVNDNTLYVWKNKNNKIVSIAFYDVLDNKAKLAGVYTPKDERNKGYAANLIYSITNEILSKGLVPLLYTDYNYKPSNIAYQNAGYEDKGVLINFTCSKQKTRKL